MVSRVYLHIGRAKTGTTAIQRALQKNRAHLETLGFRYPGETRNHNPAVPDIPNGDLAARLADEVRRAPNEAIVSAEGLQNLDPAIVRDWLSGLDVRVIVYLRDQADLIGSAYQQAVKSDLEACSFEEYAARCGVQDYGHFIGDWARAFGRETITIRLYEGGDIVPDFLSVLGIKNIAPFRIGQADPNPSIGGALLEAKRRINKTWAGSAEGLRGALYAPMRALSNERPEWRCQAPASADFVAALRAKHVACNEAMGLRFQERPWVCSRYTEAEVLRLMDELLQKALPHAA